MSVRLGTGIEDLKVLKFLTSIMLPYIFRSGTLFLDGGAGMDLDNG
jgi:hypothetical protein